MSPYLAKVGKTVYLRDGDGTPGVVIVVTRVTYGLHRRITVQWPDGSTTEHRAVELRHTVPGTHYSDKGWKRRKRKASLRKAVGR